MLTRQTILVRRVVAVSLLFVAIAGIYSLTIHPYMKVMNDYREEMVSLSDRVERFNRLIRQKEIFQKQLRTVKNDRVSGQYLIKADTVTLASAALQQKVKQVVKTKGAQLVSTQGSLPANYLEKQKSDELKGGYPVSMKVAMKASLDSAYEVFHTLESGTNPLVVIDEVSIGRIHQGRRLNVSSGNEQLILDVRYTITAHMKING